jgi:NAD(P)-dependent dehydrogenase (short-subunit alcohol dehydrogenase family)
MVRLAKQQKHESAAAAADGRLADRVAIVTGAGQGAGAGCALALALEGAAVILVGRTTAKLDAIAAQIHARGGRARAYAGDITREPTVGGCVGQAIDAFGRIDILVNAAQSPQMRAGQLLETDDAMLTELWRSGPVATLSLMRACHPHIKLAGGGSIINFASGSMRAPANYGAYAACKAAIEMLSRAAAVEWGGDGIRVNCVFPLVQSPSMDLDFAGVDAGRRAAVINRLPLRRIGHPETDIGRAVAFLASDDAAYITGNSVKLDGGSWNAR